MVPSDEACAVRFLEARRQLALAESGLGNHQRAAALLDELLGRHGHESNPLLVGLLHQARAQVAERANDPEAAAAHHAQMTSRFRKTQNPLLIVQCERAHRSSATLAAVRSARERHQQLAHTVSAFRTSAFTSMTTTAEQAPISREEPVGFHELLSRSDEPFETGLEFVLRHTGAKNAYLYVLKSGDLRLAWSSTNEEPPTPAVAELGCWLGAVRDGARQRVTRNSHDVRLAQSATVSGYRFVALQSSAECAIVGGVILEAEPTVDLAGVTVVFDALSRVIQERGLDVLAFITV
jgi:hypothetical protein